jgi:hypothetical protein
VVLYVAFNFYVEEKPHRGFPLIGSEGLAEDIPKAKQQWLGGAVSLIYDGLQVVTIL